MRICIVFGEEHFFNNIIWTAILTAILTAIELKTLFFLENCKNVLHAVRCLIWVEIIIMKSLQ